MEGLIPLMSSTDHANASEFLPSTPNNLTSILLSNFEDIITGFVSLHPKNAYLRPFSNSFSTKPSRVFLSSFKIDSSSFSLRASIVSINSGVDDRSSSSMDAVVSDFVKNCPSGLLL